MLHVITKQKCGCGTMMTEEQSLEVTNMMIEICGHRLVSSNPHIGDMSHVMTLTRHMTCHDQTKVRLWYPYDLGAIPRSTRHYDGKLWV